MTKKIRTTIHSLLIAFALLAITVSTVFAAPPMDVHIDAFEKLADENEPLFNAVGSAVDAGVMCPTGKVEDLQVDIVGPPDGTFRILNVLKKFDCEDGSGTFDVMLIVRLNLTTGETVARWNVVGGTGAYTHLHERGSLVGTPSNSNEYDILDAYDGMMH